MEIIDRLQSPGALKDKEDQRDFKISAFLTTRPIPDECDLSDDMLPIRDQGQEPSCVGFGAAATKEYFERIRLSPRYIYSRVAQPGGGAYMRDAMAVLLKKGVPEEECQPYVPNTQTEPCIDADKRAAENKIRGYARLTTVDEICRCIAEIGPVASSFGVYDSWLSPKDGVVDTKGPVRGGHAISIVGYKNKTRLLKFENTSWTNKWGDNGFGYISYDEASTGIWDAWSIVDIPEEEEEKYIPEPTPEPTPEDTRSWLKKLSDWLLSIWNSIGDLLFRKEK